MNNHFTIFRYLFLNCKINREKTKGDLGLYLYSIKLKKTRFYEYISNQKTFNIIKQFEEPLAKILIEFCLKCDELLLEKLENYIINFDILINDIKNINFKLIVNCYKIHPQKVARIFREVLSIHKRNKKKIFYKSKTPRAKINIIT